MIPEAECGLNPGSQESILAIFKNHPKVESVLLFGSRALGKYKPGSDIDLALVAPAMSLQELLHLLNQLDDLMLPYKIDALLLHQVEEPKLLEHIRHYGKILYTR